MTECFSSLQKLQKLVEKLTTRIEKVHAEVRAKGLYVGGTCFYSNDGRDDFNFVLEKLRLHGKVPEMTADDVTDLVMFGNKAARLSFSDHKPGINHNTRMILLYTQECNDMVF